MMSSLLENVVHALHGLITEQQTEQDTVLLRLENYREQRNGYDFQRVLKAYGTPINSFWNTAHS